MEYILISMLTIAVFTYIVSIVANKILATPIHMKSLILCACCALLISLILPRMFMGFAGLSGTLVILIAFAMISSYFIAYYYDNAMQKLAFREDITTELIFAETSQPDKKEEVQFVVDLTTILNPQKNTEILTDYETEDTPSISAEPKDNQMEDFSVKVLEKPLENTIEIAEEKIELTEELTTEIDPIIKEYHYPLKYEDYNLKVKSQATVKAVEEIEVETKAINTLPILEMVQEDINTITANELLSASYEIVHDTTEATVKTEILPNTELEESLDELEMATLEETTLEAISEIPCENSYPNSNDLDDLMDFAFLQKEQRKFLEALETFREALRLYPNSEVAPFLIVEIGTILKNTGSYDEAIEIFIEGRSLPSIINNSILEQEFINNIAYLRVVKNILVENSLEFTPFSLIPESALKKIDEKFCEWRNQS